MQLMRALDHVLRQSQYSLCEKGYPLCVPVLCMKTRVQVQDCWTKIFFRHLVHLTTSTVPPLLKNKPLAL